MDNNDDYKFTAWLILMGEAIPQNEAQRSSLRAMESYDMDHEFRRCGNEQEVQSGYDQLLYELEVACYNK